MTKEAEVDIVEVDESVAKEAPEADADVVQSSPEEQKAEGFGWMPKEKWVEEGKSEDEWVPAKQFLKFGELKQQVIAKEKQLTKQEKVIKLMKNHHMQVKESAYKEALKQLRAEREAALEDNDFVKAERVKDRIEDIRERQVKDTHLPPEVEREMQEVGNIGDPPPEFYQFSSRNPWYIADPQKQDDLSKEADVVGYAYVEKNRLTGKTVTADDVYTHVEKYMKRSYPEKFGTPANPQTDTASRGSSGKAAPSKLSPAEREVMEQFGLTEKAYLEEQKKYRGH